MKVIQSILILISFLFSDTTTDFSKISLTNKKDKGFGVDLSFPNDMLGFYLYTTNTEKLGYYFDFRGEFFEIIEKYIYSPEGGIRTADFVYGDNRISLEIDYMMCNVGLVKDISNNIFLYGGGGISLKYNFYQYYDESEIRGKNGEYWMRRSYSQRLNFISGMIILPKEDDFFNQIKLGINSAPLELSIGLGWSLFKNY